MESDGMFLDLTNLNKYKELEKLQILNWVPNKFIVIPSLVTGQINSMELKGIYIYNPIILDLNSIYIYLTLVTNLNQINLKQETKLSRNS
jgi:hypothetical protein